MTKDELTQIVIAAMHARDDVRAYRTRNKVSPKIVVDSVLTFQKLEPNLTDDGKWGPNSVAAATYYLSKMTDNEVPTYHPAFKTSKLTWVQPVIDKEVAPAPKPVIKAETKPTVKTKTKAKPKVTQKPKKAKASTTKFPDLSKLKLDIGEAVLTNNTPNDAEEAISKEVLKAADKTVKKVEKSFKKAKEQIVKDRLVTNKKFEDKVIDRLNTLQDSINKHDKRNLVKQVMNSLGY